MSNKSKSTFEREMQDASFREQFDKEYEEFALSEVISAKMEDEDVKPVRKLAEEVGLSPTVIQKFRSRKQDDIRLSNFINISRAYGYNLYLEKDNSRISL